MDGRVYPVARTTRSSKPRSFATLLATSQCFAELSHWPPQAMSNDRVDFSPGRRRSLTIRLPARTTGVVSTNSSTVVYRVVPLGSIRCRTHTSWSPYLRAKRLAPSWNGEIRLATRKSVGVEDLVFEAWCGTWSPVRPNVRAKRTTAAGRQARAVDDRQHRRAGLGACRWRSA